MFAPPRRKRRYGWWLVAIAIAVVGLALLTGGLRTETRQLTEFFDETRTLAMESDQIASDFRQLIREELQTVTREDFDVLMDRLEALMLANAAALTDVPTPDSASAADEFLLGALDSWASGLGDFRTAVVGVTDDPLGTAPVDRLSAAILQLRFGDFAYAKFRDRANELVGGLDVTIGEFPIVAFVTTEPVLLNNALLARIIRGSTALGERHDVSILTVVYDPVPTGGAGSDGEIIFPAADRFQFGAVVSNLGNVDEKDLVITFTFQNEEGAVIANEESGAIELSPGESDSILFAAQEVSPGDEYTLSFTLTVVVDDLNTADNTWEARIRINALG